MTLALDLSFGTPALLIGLLAAAIPFLLHLMSSVKAQEVYFPTLRFLKTSMQKTARRRQIQQWLLLSMRALLLGLLALAVAEPVTKASSGWMGQRDYAAVIILDNSYSMQARDQGGSDRLHFAITEAQALLRDDKPREAALLTTAGGFNSQAMTSKLDALREQIDKTRIGYGSASVSAKLEQAINLLDTADSSPQKSIYLFGDLQRNTFENLPQLKALAARKNIHLFIINCSHRPATNIGVTNLEVAGRQLVDQPMTFTATLTNSSPGDRKVEVVLRVDGRVVGQPVTKTLRGAGKSGASSTVRFYHSFASPGPSQGDVLITTEDDLPQDNSRRFAVTVGTKVPALLVRGNAAAQDEGDSLDPIGSLRVALDPFGDLTEKMPWSIVPSIVEAGQLKKEHLQDNSIAFFCEVPSFTADQARDISEFVANGGTAVFFLGPGCDADNYNKLLGDKGGVLPATVSADAVGEVGPGADAFLVDTLDLESPYLANLYPNPSEYKVAQVQRYYTLKASKGARVLLAMENGQPLMVQKGLGSGTAILCSTTAAPRWSKLSGTGARVFVPMVVRMCLYAPKEMRQETMFVAGKQVPLQAGMPTQQNATRPMSLDLTVTSPAGSAGGQSVAKASWDDKLGYVGSYRQTNQPGLYRWSLARDSEVKTATGQGHFVINPAGAESNLESFEADTYQKALNERGLEHAYVAASTKDANAIAVQTAEGHNWWDLALALVIVLLVGKAVVSNRKKLVEDVIPSHLNPKLGK